MPTPGKNESQEAFMGRCMKVMHQENETKKRPVKQMAAICHSLWTNKGKKTASQSAIDEQANKFMAVFLEKYPEYKSYFEEVK